MFEALASLVSTIIAAVITLVSPVHTNSSECSALGKISYCYTEGESDRLVYFLHGFANDETAWSWNPVTGKIEEEWKTKGTARPHIVSISMGGFWLYTPEKGKQLQEFIAEFEKRFEEKPKRVLYGDSMGGHNSLRWAMDYPQNFERIALICPALPHSLTLNSETKSGFWPATGLAELMVGSLYWESTSNPLAILSSKESQIFQKDFFVAISKNDFYGFYEGNSELSEIFSRNSTKAVVTDIQDVIHCNIEAKKLAPFLAIY